MTLSALIYLEKDEAEIHALELPPEKFAILAAGLLRVALDRGAKIEDIVNLAGAAESVRAKLTLLRPL